MPIKREYQRCTNCVMDTTDSKITFDENGVCDWCNDYYNNILPSWEKQLEQKDALKEISEKIKADSKNRKYDCIIGMSGGVDSSYLCYIAKEIMGLNPLIYVVDTGWNLKIADENIDKIVNALNLDKYTEVVDWDEMRDLQLAFLKSQVPYQDFPQDHAIFAGLYKFAVKNKIKYVLTGANNATECIRPPIEWVYNNDIKFMKDIHKKFGTLKLKKFPTCSMVRYRIVYPIFYGMKRVAPLNMVEYDKDKVKEFLKERFDWIPYDNKHYENVFTRWFEGYYLPHKFGYDKRKCYLSNLILTSGLSRDDAIAEVEHEPYPAELVKEDTAYIANKLGLTVKELEELIEGENKTFENYKNSYGFIKFGTFVLRKLGIEKKQFR